LPDGGQVSSPGALSLRVSLKYIKKPVVKTTFVCYDFFTGNGKFQAKKRSKWLK
jgi:hypothetical protein